MTSSLRADARSPIPLTDTLLSSWALPSHPGDSKFERGTTVVIGGTSATAGAVLLAGEAALRVGAGRLQIATVAPAVPALMAAVPEALVEGLPCSPGGNMDAGRIREGFLRLLDAASAVLIGPGTHDVPDTSALLARLLPHIGTEAVVVLDAAAIAAIASMRPDLRPFRGRLVMTPNRGEAEDLVGREADAVAVARAERAVVSMDGLVATHDGRSWIASRRLPGLGTSGSGDVLAGLVAGSAARSGDAAQAACWATYLHVAAGAEASRRIGPLRSP
jgi:hydroxyethylthiazole kinase-like uncharacterized protein yjeF